MNLKIREKMLDHFGREEFRRSGRRKKAHTRGLRELIKKKTRGETRSQRGLTKDLSGRLLRPDCIDLPTVLKSGVGARTSGEFEKKRRVVKKP